MHLISSEEKRFLSEGNARRMSHARGEALLAHALPCAFPCQRTASPHGRLTDSKARPQCGWQATHLTPLPASQRAALDITALSTAAESIFISIMIKTSTKMDLR
eukprot:613270-Pleurochrysis_carterae.AAC.1